MAKKAKQVKNESKTEKNKVILAVNGGVVSAVKIPHGVVVVIKDYDVEGFNENMLLKDREGDSYRPIVLEGFEG